MLKKKFNKICTFLASCDDLKMIFILFLRIQLKGQEKNFCLVIINFWDDSLKK